MKRKPAVGSGAIRQRNEQRILAAAQDVFALKGFDGASTAAIARMAGVPKANLHYYFRTKQALYARVLDVILEPWLQAMDAIHADAEPAAALEAYIAAKIEASKRSPKLSRIWARELIGGASHVQPFLRRRLRRIVDEKSRIIEGWIASGKVNPVNPRHLLFMIWATTQTYADFASQIEAVLGRRKLTDDDYREARQTVVRLVLLGLGLQPHA